jgi:hypothetical protein
MPRLDDLPADQRAVLQLVLRQGRSYADIAATLRLGEDAVRRRAHAGLDALAPAAGAAGAARARAADWLLGQQDAGEAAATEAALADDPATRAWARAVAAELEPVAARPLPTPPEGPAAAEPHDDEPHDPEPYEAEPYEADPHDAEPYDAEPYDAEPAAAAPGPGPARSRPRASRRGGALLLAAVVLVAVVALVLVLRGGDDDGAQRAASTSTEAAQAGDSGRIVAQVNLRPPEGAPRPRALGVVQVLDAGGRQAINAIVQGLRRPRTNTSGYGMWLIADDGRRRWLGYFNTADEQGRLVAVGQLDRGIDVLRFDRMLVTRETSTRPRQPGTAYLQGAIARASAQQQGAGG